MGGGSLKWGPPLVKSDLDYRFFFLKLQVGVRVVGTHLSGFVGLSGLPFLASGFVFLSGFVLLGVKLLDVFDKFVVFEKEVTTLFSLEYQRKVYLFVICRFFLLNK